MSKNIYLVCENGKIKSFDYAYESQEAAENRCRELNDRFIQSNHYVASVELVESNNLSR